MGVGGHDMGCICPPVHLSSHQSVHLSICAPVHLCTCPCVHLSKCPQANETKCGDARHWRHSQKVKILLAHNAGFVSNHLFLTAQLAFPRKCALCVDRRHGSVKTISFLQRPRCGNSERHPLLSGVTPKVNILSVQNTRCVQY